MSFTANGTIPFGRGSNPLSRETCSGYFAEPPNLGVGKNCDGIPTVLQVRSRPGVSSLAVDIQEARAQSAKVSEEALTIDLDDGRTIVVPLGLVSSPLAWHASGTQSS